MISKLFEGLERIGSSDSSQLTSVDYLTDLIRNIGLKRDPFNTYGDDSPWINEEGGVWQQPIQLAKALICLHDKKISKFLDIGTNNGWTTAILTAYLNRFSPMSCITIDPIYAFTEQEVIEKLLPITYICMDSHPLSQSNFDACFIDGDHNYRYVKWDYDLVGCRTPICVFHDINNPVCVQMDAEGSVPRFWNELKAREPSADFIEINDHPNNIDAMGIGIRIKKS